MRTPNLASRALLVVVSTLPALADERPNIVIVMADDMGYSDIGCYGGEIETPNLDRLAAGGLRFTQFYNTGRCCPTRASLLTGLYAHQAGIGHMTSESVRMSSDWGRPGYRGRLNRRCVTIAEVLKPAGYHTLMAGKWHVGTFEGMWPNDRGFDEFFGIVRGASNFFRPQPDKLLSRNRTPVKPPEEYYTTDAFTDYAIDFVRAIRKGKGSKKSVSGSGRSTPSKLDSWRGAGSQGMCVALSWTQSRNGRSSARSSSHSMARSTITSLTCPSCTRRPVLQISSGFR